MRAERTPRWSWALYGLLILVSLPFLLPLLWLLLSAFKTSAAIFSSPFDLRPAHLSAVNFRQVFHDYPFARQYFNSVYIAALVVPLTMGLSALAGYAFARLRFPGRDAVFILTLVAMMVPSELTAVPQFVAFSRLGITNSHLPVIITQIFSATGALAVFLMRQHFITLPPELDDAGRVDGLGTLGVFRHIMLPLSRPALATVAIFTFEGAWDSYVGPLLYLNDEKLYTLQVGLQFFRTATAVQWQYLMAAALLVMLPVIILFFVFQKYFVEGAAVTGGVKG